MEDFLWNETFTNVSWDPDFDQTPGPQSRLVTALGSLVCIWILVSNLLLVISVIFSGGLTKDPFKIILLHLSSLDFSLGLLAVPFMLHYVRVGYWDLGKSVCAVWIALDHFLLVLILVTWLVLSVDRLLFTLRPGQYRNVVKSWVAMLMVWIPWVTCSIIAGPLFYMSITDSYVPTTECYNVWALKFYMIFLVLTFFVPLVVSLVTLMATALILARNKNKYMKRRTNNSPYAGGLNDIEDRDIATQSTVILGLTNCTFVVMCLPFFSVTLAVVVSGYRKDVDDWVINLLYWIVYSNSAVRPLFWFMLKELRQGCTSFCRLVCRRKPPSLDQSTQTFREKEVRFKDFDCSKLKSADV